VASSNKTGYEAVDEYVTARMRSDRIPGVALAIVKGDRIVYLQGYGRADQSGRRVTPQTPFIIGSVTKPMTALAVMQLVEAGKVELDAPVRRYIPWFRVADPKASAEITVRMLIDQTSGLPQDVTIVTWTWPDEPDAIERHVRLLANARLVFPPGHGFLYSNGNYATLGMLVQAVSGLSYEDYVRRHIFTPLDMQHSHVSQEAAMRDGMATGYRWWFGSPIPATLPYNRANLPAGFAICSAEDMGHFLIAQMNGGRYGDTSVLSPRGIALMQAEPPPEKYGLGWESVRIDGRRLVNHDGATANYQCSLFMDPKDRVGVFLAADVMNGLDGLSSSRSSASRAGTALITTRDMSLSVLNMAAGRPLPRQGPGQSRVSLIVDLVILLLTGALILSLVRIPEWYGQLAVQGIAGWSELSWRVGLIAVLHFTLPVALLYVMLRVPYWIFFALYQPDLVVWLETVAAVLFLKGLLEIALASRILWPIH
jgi:CubicO group peptidase (beta-lactamase class C family)